MVDNLDNGQLNVKLDLIISQLEKVTKDMVTKDVFDTWRQSYSDRMVRLENDHQGWVQASTSAHVKMEAESKARHEVSMRKVDELEKEIEYKLDEQRKRGEAIEAEQRNRKNSTAKFVVGLVVTSLLSVTAIVASLITAYIT